MSLQLLLHLLHLRRDVLVSEDEIYWSSHGPDGDISRALCRHRKGVRLLFAWSSIDVCQSRDLHRRYWRYAGEGRYICSKCEELARYCA